MAFSDAFARGVAIGTEAKKRRAAQKFFGRLQEMTADDEQQNLATAIPFTPESPVQAEGAPAIAQTPQAIEVAAPPRIDKKGRLSTLSPNSLKELDDAAVEFAKASGDPDGSIYNAAKGMVKGRIRDGFRGSIASAMTALQAGDTSAAEKAIKRANFWIPDGNDIEIKKGEDGQLRMTNPLTGKEEAVTTQMLSQLARIAEDPIAAGEYIDRQIAAAREGDQKDRQLTTGERAVEVQEGQLNESRRSALVREAEEAKDGPVNRRLKESQIIQNLRYADYLSQGKGKGGAGAISQDDARKLSNDIFGRVGEILYPTKLEEVTDPVTGATSYKKVQLPPPAQFGNIDRVGQNNIAKTAENLIRDNAEGGMTIGEAIELAMTAYAEKKGAKK